MKQLLWFLLGAAAGSGITYVLIKDTYEQMAIEEVDEMKEYYKEKMEEKDEKDKGVTANIKTNIPEKPDLDVLAKEQAKSERIAYNNKYVSPEDEEVEDEAPNDDPPDEYYYDDQEKYDKQRKFRKPYIITGEAYDNENLHYDKLSFGYYVEDDVLVDDNEDIVTGISETVGDEALVSFGDDSDDPDIVYVRNEGVSADIEIIRIEESYKESVLGMVGEDDD